MKSLLNLVCILCASILLVGCAYFDPPEFEPAGGVKLVSSNDPPPRSASENVAPTIPKSKAAVRASDDGRVQIFSLDNGREMRAITRPVNDSVVRIVDAPQATPLTPAPMQSFSNNPSVEIYSLDGGFGAPTPITRAGGQENYELGALPQDFNPTSDKVIIYFNHDSDSLGSNDLTQIQSMAKNFNAASYGTLKVEGHASVKANYKNAAQKRIVNLRVSMDRAFAVSRALIERGVPAGSIEVRAWGDTKPPTSLSGKSAESAARRVEIFR